MALRTVSKVFRIRNCSICSRNIFPSLSVYDTQQQVFQQRNYQEGQNRSEEKQHKENGKKWDEPGKPMPVRKKNVTRMHAYQREQARHLKKAQEGLAKFEMIRNEQSYETGNSVVDAFIIDFTGWA